MTTTAKRRVLGGIESAVTYLRGFYGIGEAGDQTAFQCEVDRGLDALEADAESLMHWEGRLPPMLEDRTAEELLARFVVEAVDTAAMHLALDPRQMDGRLARDTLAKIAQAVLAYQREIDKDQWAEEHEDTLVCPPCSRGAHEDCLDTPQQICDCQDGTCGV